MSKEQTPLQISDNDLDADISWNVWGAVVTVGFLVGGFIAAAVLWLFAHASNR